MNKDYNKVYRELRELERKEKNPIKRGLLLLIRDSYYGNFPNNQLKLDNMSDYVEISAKAAHDVALKVNEAIVNELKSSIMNKIADARLSGDYDIQIRFEGKPYENLNRYVVYGKIMAYLNGLGYDVYEGEDHKTTVMTISWADVDED